MSYSYQETIGQAGENLLQWNKSDKSKFIQWICCNPRSFVKWRGSAGGARPLGEAAECIQVFKYRFFTKLLDIANFIFRNKLEVVRNDDQVVPTYLSMPSLRRQPFLSLTEGTWCPNTERRGCNDLESLFTGLSAGMSLIVLETKLKLPWNFIWLNKYFNCWIFCKQNAEMLVVSRGRLHNPTFGCNCI